MSKPRRKIVDRHVQARLRATDPHEYDALEVFADWLDAGYEQREIITRALLALGDKTQPVNRDVLPPWVVAEALESHMERVTEDVIDAIESKLSNLKIAAPTEQRQQVSEAVRSSFRSSIANSVDVAEYKDE